MQPKKKKLIKKAYTQKYMTFWIWMKMIASYTIFYTFNVNQLMKINWNFKKIPKQKKNTDAFYLLLAWTIWNDWRENDA